jgi:membrane dipeptidase
MSHVIHRLHALAGVASLLIAGSLAACDPPKLPPRVTTQAPEPEQPDKLAPQTLEERAQLLAQRLVIVDGHIDLPYRLEKGRNQAGEISEDVTQRTEEGDFDWVRAKAGGLDAPFMSIYVPAHHQTDGGAKALADKLIDSVEAIASAAPDKFVVAKRVADVTSAFIHRKVALPLGIENGAALEGKLENVKHFHGRGVRYITLTHSKDNDICDSSYDDSRTHGGLSAFGKEVVAEMNRLGIMIDVSHISDDAFWQVMEETKVPVIASHSSCRHFTPGFERNMSDEMIERLASVGGVIMINYGSTFLTAEARAWSDEFKKARTAFSAERKVEGWDHPEMKAFIEQYKTEHPLPRASVTDVADHIQHVIELVGVDHVGLGSDFDGVGDSLPSGLEDASKLPNLLAELLRRGVSEKDIAKICGINVLRVWAKVEKHAEKALSAH